MTVCIAAMAVDAGMPVIMGASDRMLTAGDIEFEPTQSKMRAVTTSIVMMIAGDAAVQGLLYQRMIQRVRARLEADSSTWFGVEEAALMFSDELLALRNTIAGRNILAPFGLTLDSFVRSQDHIPAAILRALVERIQGNHFDTETIFAGLDGSGGHIFVVDGEGKVSCRDAIGFAAIGLGKWHAESQFMFDRHSPFKPGVDTLMLIYSAKRRAEVAPGVGTDTDPVIIPRLGGMTFHHPGQFAVLEKLHRDLQTGIAKARERANKKLLHLLASSAAAAQPATQARPPAADTVEKSELM